MNTLDKDFKKRARRCRYEDAGELVVMALFIVVFWVATLVACL